MAPGTWSSAAAAVLVAGIAAASRAGHQAIGLVVELALAVAFAAVGVWSSGALVAAAPDDPDPPYVVIDEISGQMIALLGGIALSSSVPAQNMNTNTNEHFTAVIVQQLNWRYLALGFLLFRLFDIWKPFPARHAEALRGGLGIMADDWIAGIYAAAGLCFLRLFIF